MRSIALALLFVAAPLGFSQRQRIEGSLSLAQALAVAEQNSPALARDRANVALARAGLGVARSALMPQLSANSFATTGTYSSIISSSPGVMPPYSLAVPSGAYLDQNLMAMLPLFTGGRLQAQISSANWQQRAAEAELAEARGTLHLRVKEAYLRGLIAKQMTAVQEAKLTAAEELRRTTQAQFEAGKGIEASVQRVQAEVSRAKRSLTTARNEESKAALELFAAMGVDPTSHIAVSDGLTFTEALDPLESYVSLAKEKRGSIAAARARAQASAADVRAAEKQRSPQLYAQAMGDVASNRMGTGVTLGLTLSFPIFDGGRIRAEVDQSKAMRSRAEAELADAEISVETEVRQAWLDVQTAKSNKESAEASVVAAQSAYEVTALRVSAGKGILLEQLDALQSLTEAKADLAQALYEHQLALAKLDRATGVIK
jgi:outer membrane protein